MITEFRAENFKSWEDTGKLDFAPLTGFFGANSSGKTGILQVLLMLKQTVERPPEWNEPLYFGTEESLVNLVSFDNVIHQHNANLSLRISVSCELPEEMKIGQNLTFSMSIEKTSEHPNLHTFRYEGYGSRWDLVRDGAGYTFTFPDYAAGRHFSTKQKEAFRCYGVVEQRGGPDKYLEAFLTRQDAFENLFKRIHYLGPLREPPRHWYTWKGDHPENIGQRGEKAIPALLSGRIQLLSIEKQILEWLQRLDLIDSYRIQPNLNKKGSYDVRVTKHKGGPEVRLTDVGFGVSQVFPVLVDCYYAREGSILILEQPEAHLHPKVQSELADVLIDVVKNRNIQIILESHSEHLLHRLTRRIAEGEISADAMALYSCQINDGTSQIEPLKMDEYGNVSNWPRDFFGDDAGDVVERAKAEIKRRKANTL